MAALTAVDCLTKRLSLQRLPWVAIAGSPAVRLRGLWEERSQAWTLPRPSSSNSVRKCSKRLVIDSTRLQLHQIASAGDKDSFSSFLKRNAVRDNSTIRSSPACPTVLRYYHIPTTHSKRGREIQETRLRYDLASAGSLTHSIVPFPKSSAAAVRVRV